MTGWGRPDPATRVLIGIAALTLAGFLLRMPGLGSSLFADELGTYYLVAGRSPTGIVHLLATRTWDLNPPLFYLFAWIGRQVAGNHVQALRLISVLAGTASIPLTFVLGRDTVGRRAGLVGAGLMAVGPFMVYFSSEARAFALATFLCLLSTVALLGAVRTQRTYWWVSYAAAICAAMYTQYTSIFVLAAQFAWGFWAHRHTRRLMVGASAAAAILFAPWLPAFASQGRSPLVHGIGILEPFGLHVIGHDLVTWSVGAPFVTISSVPGALALILTAAGTGIALLGAARQAVARRSVPALLRPSANTMLLVALAAAAPLGAAAYSQLGGSSIWEAKDLITSWPALALITGLIITSAPQPAAIAGGALMLAGLTLGSARLLQADHQRPNYDAAAAYVRQVGGSRAPIAEVAGLTPGPVEAMEVATRLISDTHPNPVLRIGAPPLRLVLLNKPGAALSPPPARVVAGRAAALAVDGRLFMVALGDLPVTTLMAWRRMGPASRTDIGLSTFVRDIPPRFRITAQRTFRGFIPVSVYTFDASAP